MWPVLHKSGNMIKEVADAQMLNARYAAQVAALGMNSAHELLRGFYSTVASDIAAPAGVVSKNTTPVRSVAKSIEPFLNEAAREFRRGNGFKVRPGVRDNDRMSFLPPDEREIGKSFGLIEKKLKANALRDLAGYDFGKLVDIAKSDAVAKSILDVGTLTNFAQVTQGQAVGYFSLDTALVRGTIRPSSFPLYMMLPKSTAFQVVDFWATNQGTGGAVPGAAGSSYLSQTNQAGVTYNAGQYNLETVTLQLFLDARAITVALAAQNSFVDIAEQETINASLSILESVEWECYWGNPNIYPQQFQGLAYIVPNQTDFMENVANGTIFGGMNNGRFYEPAAVLFAEIMNVMANLVSVPDYGRTSHIMMGQHSMSDMMNLVTGELLQVTNMFRQDSDRLRDYGPMTIAGDIQGVTTRFSQAQFVFDIMINARDFPQQCVSYDKALSALVNAPSNVTATVLSSGVSASYFYNYYTEFTGTPAAYGQPYNFLGANGGPYVYAVAAVDGSSTESPLFYTAPVTGIPAGGAVQLSISLPSTGSPPVAYRIYRSGLGYNVNAPGSGTGNANNPAAFRYIGEVAANASGTTTFIDTNGAVPGNRIPGSDTLFLLDLFEEDLALDWRYLLPLSKIYLFAQNLYMPWVVAMIGAMRVKMPKFHAVIKNYVPMNSRWSPWLANTNASVGGNSTNGILF